MGYLIRQTNRRLMKTAYELKHVKQTTAICLMLDNRFAGKIVANYNYGYNGTTVTATVSIHKLPNTFRVGPGSATAKAQTLDTAIALASEELDLDIPYESIDSGYAKAFIDYGYNVIQII